MNDDVFVHNVAYYRLTWRRGVDAAEEKLSGVQNTGGQGLMADDFSLKTLRQRKASALQTVHEVRNDCIL